MFYLLTKNSPQEILSDIKYINALAWHVTTGKEIIEVFFMRTSFSLVQVDPSLPDMPLARDNYKKYPKAS